MQQVDSEDANFLFMEKVESPTHISLIYLYDQSGLGKQQVRFTHIREHVQNRLNSAPVFTQKIQRTPGDIDYPYWVNDEKFDLDFHVRHLALPQPGDWRQFCILTSRLHSRPLDMSRPLWELYVIEGLHNVEGMPKNSFAIYFKVHHCAMDEFTAQELVQSAHVQTPNPRQHESSGPAYRPPAQASPAADGNDHSRACSTTRCGPCAWRCSPPVISAPCPRYSRACRFERRKTWPRGMQRGSRRSPASPSP